MRRALLHLQGNKRVAARGVCVRAQKQIPVAIQDQAVKWVLNSSFKFC
jgi:hypothetical protein